MKVFITGINGDIAKNICQHLKYKYHSCEIYGIDLHSNATHEFCDEYIQFDLSKPVWCNLFSEYFDLVINNAAIQIVKPFFDLSDDDIDNITNVNLLNPIKMLKKLNYSNNSNIINIGSIHSSQTKKGFTIYSTTKGGLESLTKALSVELSPNIRVNMIKPAAINTKMLKNGLSKEGYDKLSSYHPVNKIGDPNNISNLIISIISNPFLNGSIIELDGGISNVLNDPDK